MDVFAELWKPKKTMRDWGKTEYKVVQNWTPRDVREAQRNKPPVKTSSLSASLKRKNLKKQAQSSSQTQAQSSVSTQSKSTLAQSDSSRPTGGGGGAGTTAEEDDDGDMIVNEQGYPQLASHIDSDGSNQDGEADPRSSTAIDSATHIPSFVSLEQLKNLSSINGGRGAVYTDEASQSDDGAPYPERSDGTSSGVGKSNTSSGRSAVYTDEASQSDDGAPYPECSDGTSCGRGAMYTDATSQSDDGAKTTTSEVSEVGKSNTSCGRGAVYSDATSQSDDGAKTTTSEVSEVGKSTSDNENGNCVERVRKSVSNKEHVATREIGRTDNGRRKRPNATKQMESSVPKRSKATLAEIEPATIPELQSSSQSDTPGDAARDTGGHSSSDEMVRHQARGTGGAKTQGGRANRKRQLPSGRNEGSVKVKLWKPRHITRSRKHLNELDICLTSCDRAMSDTLDGIENLAVQRAVVSHWKHMQKHLLSVVRHSHIVTVLEGRLKAEQSKHRKLQKDMLTVLASLRRSNGKYQKALVKAKSAKESEDLVSAETEVERLSQYLQPFFDKYHSS